MGLKAIYDVPAPAKLNLFLHVVGRRPDGYHLLQSVFVLLDWFDTLHLEIRTDGRLSRHDLGPALPDDDLCLRAARALQQHSGTGLGADISIQKRVPWGAGLGGGSSDAASTLLALNRLWNLRWPRERLAALALTLGADVPFFIGGQNAFVEGIGEQLTPLALPRQWLAVLKPPEAIPTAAIFSSPLLARDSKPVIVMDFLADNNQSDNQSFLAGNGEKQCEAQRAVRLEDGFGRNDLQPAAESHCAQVAQAAHWLLARFGNSRMSGSGSAVFARAGMGGLPKATWLAEEVPAGWEARMCRSLVQHPLVDWVG